MGSRSTDLVIFMSSFLVKYQDSGSKIQDKVMERQQNILFGFQVWTVLINQAGRFIRICHLLSWDQFSVHYVIWSSVKNYQKSYRGNQEYSGNSVAICSVFFISVSVCVCVCVKEGVRGIWICVKVSLEDTGFPGAGVTVCQTWVLRTELPLQALSSLSHLCSLLVPGFRINIKITKPFPERFPFFLSCPTSLHYSSRQIHLK